MAGERVPIFMKDGLECLKRDYPRFDWEGVELDFTGATCDIMLKDRPTGKMIPARVIHGRNRYY